MEHYHLHYSFASPGVSGVGRTSLYASIPICTPERAKEVEQSVLSQEDSCFAPGTNIVLLSWQKFEPMPAKQRDARIDVLEAIEQPESVIRGETEGTSIYNPCLN